ncbi:MAG: hypothetical protein AAFN07_13985 [Pseudomonadota bacterium]
MRRLAIASVAIALAAIVYIKTEGGNPKTRDTTVIDQPEANIQAVSVEQEELEQATLQPQAERSGDFEEVVASAEESSKPQANKAIYRTPEEVSGSRVSQRLGVLYESDKPKYLEFMEQRFQDGLDDVAAIETNNKIIANHMEVVMQDSNFESEVSCSREVCYVDVVAPDSTDSMKFGMAFNQGWRDVEEFTQLFFAERLNENQYRFFFAREGIDLESLDSEG